MILSRYMLRRVGESRHPCPTPTVFSEPVSYAAVEEDCTSGLVIEVFDDLDQVGVDVVLLHCCPPNGASSKIRGRDNVTIGTWNTRTLRPAGKLQELTHEMEHPWTP